MTPEATLGELRSVLEMERAAIRRLDTAGITAASRSKEALIAVIAAAVEPERTPMLQALAQVRGDIKRNLVLLAHARDFVREAAETVRKRSGPRVTIQL
ncbi:MAG TPA: hypothetical protein VLT33_26580 [Labilithrix sp.]|nr:hypothetical protein [Labilithrix sp.]